MPLGRRLARLLVGILVLPTALGAQAPAGDSVRTLSLEQALAQAERVNENIGIARAGIERARGEQLRARSEYFPQLNGSASYTRTFKSQFSRFGIGDSTASDTTTSRSCGTFAADPTQPIGARVDTLERAVECLSREGPFGSLSGLPFGQKNQYNFGLSFSQTLYAGGRISGQSRAAAAGRRSAELELSAQRAQVRLDVTQAYLDAVLSDRLLAIAEGALVQSERTLNEVRLARQVGTQPEFELLRATVARDNQRPVVIQRRQQRDISLLRLKQLLELPLGDSVALTTSLGDAADTTLPVLPAVAGELGDTTTASRVSVRQAVEAVQSQEGQYAVARAGALPQVKVTSQFAQIAFPSDLLPSGDDFVTDWNVALTVTLPLFTGGRLTGDRVIARSNLDAARLRLRQTAKAAALDSWNVYATLAASEAAWAASAGTVEQARRAYQIAEIRYREGVSTQTELSESRLQLAQAQANRAQAARDLQIARTRIILLRDLPLSGTGAGSSVTSTGAAAPPTSVPATTVTPVTTTTGLGR